LAGIIEAADNNLALAGFADVLGAFFYFLGEQSQSCSLLHRFN